MSVWRGYTKRFQKDFDKLPLKFREYRLRESNKYALPTLEQPYPTIPKEERKSRLEQIGFTAGDLAYITEGPKKGTVSKILRYMPEYDGALLMEVTSKKLVPKHSWVNNQQSYVFDFPDVTPAANFKLAAKDKDEKTGEIYYIVADAVTMRGRYYDDRYRKWMPRRFVKDHANIEIPWPSPEEVPADDALSTATEKAHETTYELQTLAKPPMPAEVVAELRNPHSSHKKRYLSEYQARVMQHPEMPLSLAQKVYLAKRDAESAQKQAQKTATPLTDEIKTYIGEKMAAHLNKIDNPHLLAHLDDLSSIEIPAFNKEAATKK